VITYSLGNATNVRYLRWADELRSSRLDFLVCL
jgi:hypothetical protein